MACLEALGPQVHLAGSEWINSGFGNEPLESPKGSSMVQFGVIPSLERASKRLGNHMQATQIRRLLNHSGHQLIPTSKLCEVFWNLESRILRPGEAFKAWVKNATGPMEAVDHIRGCGELDHFAESSLTKHKTFWGGWVHRIVQEEFG